MEEKNTSQVDLAIAEIRQEYFNARGKHPEMHSPHEGSAVIMEELDELWAEVKERYPHQTRMRVEARQVAAMALAFMAELTPVCGAEKMVESLAKQSVPGRPNEP